MVAMGTALQTSASATSVEDYRTWEPMRLRPVDDTAMDLRLIAHIIPPGPVLRSVVLSTNQKLLHRAGGCHRQ